MYGRARCVRAKGLKKSLVTTVGFVIIIDDELCTKRQNIMKEKR